MSAAELRSLLIGNTASGQTAYGEDWHSYPAPDGKFLVRLPNGETLVETWEITDDGQFCRLSGSRKRCWIYFKKSDVYEYWYPDRSRMRGKFKLRTGNPENL